MSNNGKATFLNLFTRIGLGVFLVLVIVGCQTRNRDRGFVQREWSLSLRELGIVPVFPPREDFLVGDVYAYDFDPESKENRRIFETKWSKLTQDEKDARLRFGMNSRMARIDFNQELYDEYRRSLAAPATPADYNSILGNPALAAAKVNVTRAKAAVTKIQNDIKAKKTAAELAAKNESDATRVKADADRNVTRAEADLGAAKKKPQNTVREEAAVAAAEAAHESAEDAHLLAKHALDSSTVTPKPPLLVQDEKDKLYLKNQTNVNLTRAKADLKKKQDTPVDVSAEEGVVASAKLAQRAAETDLETKKRLKIDADAEYTKIQADKAAALEKATQNVTVMETRLKAIAASGAKMLYPQPRDNKYNVYNLWKLPVPNAKTDDLANARSNRLRLVGFPEFSTVSFSQGDLAALIPIEAMMFGLNISQSSINRVSVKVPAAESYGLSIKDIYPKLIASAGSVTLNHDLLNTIRFQFGTNDNKPVHVRVITEVFYARALDVTLFSSQSFGLRAQADAVTPPSGTGTDTAAPSAPGPTNFPVDASSTGTATGTAAVDNLRSRLGTTQTVPGGAVQFLGYSEQSIGLRRVFDRPIAIGFRGLILKVDPVSGSIVTVGSTTGPVPEILQ